MLKRLLIVSALAVSTFSGTGAVTTQSISPSATTACQAPSATPVGAAATCKWRPYFGKMCKFCSWKGWTKPVYCKPRIHF
jgi:hypothetical protein